MRDVLGIQASMTPLSSSSSSSLSSSSSSSMAMVASSSLQSQRGNKRLRSGLSKLPAAQNEYALTMPAVKGEGAGGDGDIDGVYGELMMML
jgi:hypothetical protein